LLEERFGAGVTFDEAKPECIIELDDFEGEHRNCDLVVFCNVGTKRMVINVEAKADEAFGDLIGKYYDQRAVSSPDGQPSRSNVPARIRQLSQALFGREPDEAIRRLRYQLLHAAAATLIETKKNGAEMGLFLIHEFHSASLNPDKLSQNAADWENFVHAFRISRASCGSNRREPDSRSSFGDGRRARAAFCAASSRALGHRPRVGHRDWDWRRPYGRGHRFAALDKSPQAI
jgi:hypothetical protein